METTWKAKTKYYTEQPKEVLNTPLDLAFLSQFGYPSTIEEIPQWAIEHYGITDSITLGMLIMTPRELANGNIAFNIQIRPYQNFLAPSSCVGNYITEEQFEVAKQMYQTNSFLSVEEYKQLEVISEE